MPGSCDKSWGLDNDRQPLAIALERVGWSLCWTGHEPIHQFPHQFFSSLHFNESDDDCVTNQTRDVVNIQPLH